MRCIFCDNLESKVIDSRPVDDGFGIRRRRECLKCKKRFTTYERAEKATITIIKKDGKKELFDRSKLLTGVVKAAQKTNLTFEDCDEIVSLVIKEIEDSNALELTSREVGEIIMGILKTKDPVAYVRFASVYREFKDIDTFIDEIQSLIKKK